MRAETVERVLDAPLKVLVERRLGTRLVVIRHRLGQDRPVAGFLQIRGHAQDQPEGIVVEVAADRVVAALGERLVLVVRAARGQLRRGDVQDALARPRRHHVDEAEQILVGVAEPHPAADPRLEVRRRPGHVERDHALVRVPDVDHPVGVLVGRGHLEDAERPFPVRAQIGERRVRGRGVKVLRNDRFDGPFVDRLRAGRIELGICRVFVVPQQEDDLPAFAGLEGQLDVVRADRLPAVGDRIERLAARHGRGVIPAVVRSQERLRVGCQSRPAARSRRRRRSDRGAPGTRSCGRSPPLPRPPPPGRC